MTPSARLAATVLGTPDPQGLARFYQRLLGWPIREDDPQWTTLRPADGGPGLSFQREEEHVPPVWPPEPGAQQMQLHLDILVEDLEAASALAEGGGARRLGGHTDDDEDVRVFADPAGHPFCLFVRLR
ncbi:VOC family protein [Blastococcus saxobsidens]|uniref:Putative enzyme related to lactoylglutathione lyase n=1 Tax=Blastococcus saxobsidens TaxID=138336 RepID=A0A4Q7Y3T8_9ACTN|nr:VOC family protein [Blastococcus saxobsidens]RZU30505.1 putative enzyme related to lactoylglutathione lyase [Blastococcus saxobsidens]